jgi:hypothetical protein
MCIHLGHNDRLIAFAFERSSQPLFAHAFVIFPGIVEEVDAVVQRLRNHVVHFTLSRRRA